MAYKKKFALIIIYLFIGFISFAEELDLRQTPNAFSKQIELRGNWDFYWNEFVDPVTMKSMRKPLQGKVPSYWCDYERDGENVPARGFSTYALRILLPKDFVGHDLSIFFPFVDVAFKLFINGEELYSCGNPAKTEDLEVPMYSPNIIRFVPNSDTLNIILHVSSFNHRRGGIWKVPVFGEAKVIEHTQNRSSLLSLLVMGSLLSFGFFFLMFWFFYRQGRSIFYFGVSFFFAFLRGMATDQFFVFLMASSFSWAWVIRIEYISTFLLLLFCVLGMNYMSEKPYFKLIIYIVAVLDLICCLLIVILPVEQFAYLVYPLWGLLSFAGLLFVVQSYHIMKEGLTGRIGYAVIYIISLVFLISSAIHDLFVSNGIGNSKYILPYSFLLFILALLFGFFRRYAAVMEESKNIGRKLSSMNLELEKKVEKRTSELQEKTAMVEHQNKLLQEDIALKNRMFSIIGHDVNSPLASIRQGLYLLSDRELRLENQSAFLEKLTQSANSLSMLVENLLSWGLSQNRQLKTDFVMYPICFCIEESVEQLRPIAESKKISIIIDVDQNLVARFDRMSMQIVIRNLVSNALKFTNSGGRINLTDEVHEDHVTIMIRDNGIGMSQETMEKILNKAEFVPGSGTNNEHGTGLGLSLCIDLIRLNGSELHVKSELGKGTCFSFDLSM